MSENKALTEIFEFLHWALGWTLLTVLAGHILAVPLHHIGLNDPILSRMRCSKTYLSLIGLALAFGTFFYFSNQPIPENTIASTKERNIKTKEKAPEVTSPEVRAKLSTRNEWQLIKEKSKFKFTAFQKSAGTEGEFGAFAINLSFDEENPSAALLEVLVDMKTMTMHNDLADTTLHSSFWFDVETFPVAKFTANGFRKISGNDYEVKGPLTIRDKTKTFVLPIKITITDDKSGNGSQILRATGKTTILRLNYSIGSGEWESTDVLKNEVNLDIDITASKKPDN